MSSPGAGFVCTQGRLVINQYYTGKRRTNLPSNLEGDLTNEADVFGMGTSSLNPGRLIAGRYRALAKSEPTEEI